MNRSNIIVIYPGRFQPFHKGHKQVFEYLKKDWPHVYIATTNKVQSGKSPFDFQDKLKFMELLNVDRDDVLQVTNTYNGQEYIDHFDKKFTASNTGLIMVVSEKDMVDDPRFNFPNLGVSLKKDGNPAYLQKFTKEENMKSMVEHGYIMTAPIFPFKIAGHDLDSASQIRELMKGDQEQAKQVFVDLYDKYNEDIFNLIREKLMMNEQQILDLNYMRKMAGLNEVEVDDEDYVTSPGYKEMPMFDQLGKIIDSDEMSKDGDDIKNPKSTVKTDDGSEIEVSVDEAKAIRKMLNMLASNRGGDDKSPREKFQDAIQQEEGLRNMIDFAKSKGLVEEGDMEEGNAYGHEVQKLKAAKMPKGTKFKTPDGKEHTLEDIGFDFINYIVEKEGILKKLTKAAGATAGATAGAVASDGNPAVTVGGAFAGMEGGDILATALDRFLVKNKLTASGIKDRLISFIERTIQGAKDDGVSKLNRATDALGRIYKDKKAKESVDLNDIRHDYGVTPVSEGGNAFDLAMTDAENVISMCSDQEECLKDLEALMVDDPKDFDEKYANEIVQDYITMVVDKGIEGAKEHVEKQNEEPEGAPLESKGAKPDYLDFDKDGDKEEPMKKALKDKEKKKKEESFDPRAEQSREDQAYEELMDALDKGGEEAYAKAVGLSMEELDDEMSEIGREKGLHMDDDRDEIIQIHAEETVDNADWKDHGEMDYDREDAGMEEDLNRMRELAGIEEMSSDQDIPSSEFRNFGAKRKEIRKVYGEEGEKYYEKVWQQVKMQRGEKATAEEAARLTAEKFKGKNKLGSTPLDLSNI